MEIAKVCKKHTEHYVNFIVDLGMWYMYIVNWNRQKRLLHLLQFRFTRSDDGMHTETRLSLLLEEFHSKLSVE